MARRNWRLSLACRPGGFTLGCGVGFILIGRFYARPLRTSGLETVAQYLTINYGREAGLVASCASSLGILFSAVASALSAIPMLSMLFGLPRVFSGGIIIILVIGYVLVGGVKGAGAAGLFKLGVIWMTLFSAGAVAMVFLYHQPDFGTRFPAYPWFSLVSRGVWQTGGNLFSLIVGIVCTQSYIQALYAASDSRTAAMGAYTAAAISIPLGLPSVAIGMAMRVIHPGIEPVLVLPAFLIEHMPPVIAGIGIGGLLLSVVGSIAGLALGIGTMVARDIGQAVLGVTSDRSLLRLNRATVLMVASISVWIAEAHIDSYVLDWNFMSMALRGAGVFLPLSLAIITPHRLPARWAILSMVASTLAAVAAKLIFHIPVNPLFIGLAVSLLVVFGGIASALRHRNGPFSPPGYHHP